MSLHEIYQWLLADWTHPILGGLGALFVYAHVWAAVRVSYERVNGVPMPRNKLVLWLDVLADLANNVPGAFNRILRRGGQGLFLPSEAPKGGEGGEVQSHGGGDLEAAVTRLLAAEDSLAAIRERLKGEPSATLEAGESVFIEERDNALGALRDIKAGGEK